mmetsp:Transcript_28437/g.65513  ORF Transcript_28437/g.65513 Transcript_28437/m.65513 type:complete len:98 (+) Transcript_28437:351-644(+)
MVEHSAGRQLDLNMPFAFQAAQEARQRLEFQQAVGRNREEYDISQCPKCCRDDFVILVSNEVQQRLESPIAQVLMYAHILREKGNICQAPCDVLEQQ